MKTAKKNPYNKYFFAFCLVHLLLWTLLPTLIRYNLPLDDLEGFAWGQEWQIGYYKHPWLAPWLVAIFGRFGGASGWSLYFLSQLAVIICFWAVWKLAKQLLSPLSSLFSVLLLEGIYYYNFSSPEFNPNVVLLPLWALTVLYFYQAINTQKFTAWIKTGVFLGLAMMGKYYSVYLFLSLLLFLIIKPKARNSFKFFGIYLSTLIMLAIILPNIIWLFKHNFITLTYVLERTKNSALWWGHILNPSKFIANQLLAVSLTLILFLGAKKSNAIIRVCHQLAKLPEKSITFANLNSVHINMRKESPKSISYRQKSLELMACSNSNKEFIIFMSFAPLTLVLLTSFLTGMQLHSMYGTPLFSYLGIVLLINRYEINIRRIKPFLIMVGSVILFWVILYISFNPIGPYITQEDNRGVFPGREISQSLTVCWQLITHKPLRYVVGNIWLVGNLVYYSADHPHAYFLAEPSYNTWVNDETINREGALFIWEPQDQLYFNTLKTRFPNLQLLGVQSFIWKTRDKLPPVKIVVGIVPPSGTLANNIAIN